MCRQPLDSDTTDPQIESEQHADSILETIEREILLALRPLVVFGSLMMIAVIWAAYGEGSVTPSMILELAIFVAMGVVIFGVRRHKVRRLVIFFSTLILSVVVLWNFGPTMGAGLVFAVTIMMGTLFYGPKGAIGSISLLALVFTTLGMMTSTQQIPPFELSVNESVWARIGASTVPLLAVCSYILLRVINAVRDSMATTVDALESKRAAEVEKAQALRASMELQRLEGLGRLAGGVAHDFNNALVVFQGGIELLSESNPTPEQEETLEMMRLGVDVASTTAQSLVSFARRNPAVPGKCSPTLVLSHFGKTLSRLLPEGIKFEIDCSGDGEIPLSEGALERILLNLSLNARDAMPGGGTIRLGCEVRDDRFRLCVRDDGVGMNSETQDKVFEPFFTTKSEHGTGLGLPSVRTAIESNQGTVELTSKPGEGTAVVMEFPRLEAVVESTSEVNVDEAQGRFVLVLEDDEVIRTLFTRSLERAGLRVKSYADANGATSALGSQEFACLVTDGVVPGGGVSTLIREFLNQYSGRPVLVCSGFVESELIFENIERGEYAFLAKPFAPRELEKQVLGLIGEADAARAQ